MLTLNTLFELSLNKLSKRKRVFSISEKLPSGGIENWVQWEIIEALEDAGYHTELKDKVKKGCDILVNNEVGIELRTASNGRISWLEKAIEQHPNARFYLFTCLNREGSNAKEIFEKSLMSKGFSFKSAYLNPNMIIVVAEKSDNSTSLGASKN
jgi:hypothetical protein